MVDDVMMGERITRIETTLDYMKKQQEKQIKDTDKIIEAIKNMEEKFMSNLNNLENKFAENLTTVEKSFLKRFASKWVENTMLSIVASAGGALIIAIVMWILRGGLQ